MIKHDNARRHASRLLFHPAFGSRPQEIIGRDQVIGDFLAGLEEPIGSQQRCTFFSGQRGMGKTALLIELAEQAALIDYVPVRVTAYEGMPDEIIETLQRNGSEFFREQKRGVQGFEAGALGFSSALRSLTRRKSNMASGRSSLFSAINLTKRARACFFS